MGGNWPSANPERVGGMMTSSLFDSLTVVVPCDMSAGAVARSSSAPPCSPWDSPSPCLCSDCLPPWPVDCLARYVHLTVHTDYLRSFKQRFRIAQSIIYLEIPLCSGAVYHPGLSTVRHDAPFLSISLPQHMTQNPHAHNTRTHSCRLSLRWGVLASWVRCCPSRRPSSRCSWA